MTKPVRLRGGTAGILLFTVLLRVWDFGNPVIHVDEQFYLLVGDRMLHGAVPYLDIWDRKPIGLFLLYAFFRLLPGDGILAYQFAACASAALTALIVREGARSVGARDLGALAAGAAYLIGLSLLGGRGGQAPVFYDLLMALAGWLTLRLPWRSLLGGAVVRSGVIACLLAGVAIQFKYSPAFEGVLFGCAHLWVYARRTPGAARLTRATLLWALAGALPTLAAIGWYWQRGAFDDFWFANITSILLRPGYPLGDLAMRLLGIAAQLTPLVIAAVIAWRRRQRIGTAGDAMTLALAWLVAALIGFFAIGTFFDHYALPLLVPLCIMAGAGFSAVPRTMVAAMVLGLMLVVIERAVQPDDGPGARRVAAIVRANSGRECPWVFIGDTITYRLADACLPTPYAFPNLLAYSTEEGATGIDEAAEVRRILAQRPPVIVTSTRRLSIWNPQSLFAVKSALARDYRPVFSTPRSRWRTVVYLRRDRAFRN